MTNSKVFTYDGWTNEYIVRELTDEEQAAKDAADALAEKEAIAEQEAKAAKKLAAEAKLAALGLDADDLKALGLG